VTITRQGEQKGDSRKRQFQRKKNKGVHH